MANSHAATFVAASSRFLSVADTAPLSITGDLTIECWYRVTNAPTGAANQVLVSKYTSTSNQRSYEFAYANPSGTKRLLFTMSDTGNATTQVFGDVDLSTASYAHIAVVYTASAGSAQFFVNGLSIGVQTGLPTSIFNSTADFRIGGTFAGTMSDFADGIIDEVRVWNTARTPTQIATYWQTELLGTESGLVGYWKLNNDLTDSTTNAATLTNNNSVAFTTTIPFTSNTYHLFPGGDASVRASNSNFTTARNSATGTVQDIATSYISCGLESTNYNFFIPFFGFDSSIIPATSTINSATFKIYQGGDNSNSGSQTLALVQGHQTTWNSIAAGDFDQRGNSLNTPTEGATRVAFSSGAVTGFLDIPLNATGLTWITRNGETSPGTASASGKTQLCIRFSKDVDNSAPTTNDYLNMYMSDEVGVSNDPRLTVVTTPAAGGGATRSSLSLLGVS